MVADPEPDWIRIQSVKSIRTRKIVREVTNFIFAFLTPGSGISFFRIRFRLVRTWKRMGWTEGVDEGWLRIRNRTGSGFNQFKCIRTRKRVMEMNHGKYGGWGGGGGGG
jgi:hypothetical protein